MSVDTRDEATATATTIGDALPTEVVGTLRCGIRLLALRALGDADLAEDVAQETITRTMDAASRGRISDRDRLGAFARGIALHVISDIRRARKREASSVPDAPRQDPHPLDELVRAEEAERLRAALSTLPVRDRDVLRLAFFEGLDAAAIAKRLREPSSRVRKRKQRALERLRSAWESLLHARALERPRLTLARDAADE